MDVGDPELRRRRAQLAAELRRLCLKEGGKPGLIAVLSVSGLLRYYDKLLRRNGTHRDQLERLMREPPKGRAA